MLQLRRASVSAAIAGVAAVGLVACGLGAEPEPEPEARGAGEVTGEIAGDLTFMTMQLSPTFDDFINGLIDDFESEYADVTVEWVDVPTAGTAQKVAADAASGNLADVLDLDVATLAPLARDGRVLDMAQVASDAESDFVDTAWGMFRFGDLEVAALPWYLNTPVLMVNTAILEEAGLTTDDAPQTYREMMEQSDQIAQQTGTAGFQPTVRGLLDMMVGYGVPMTTEDGTEAVVDTPEALELVERLNALYETGGIPADSITAQQRSEIETFQDAGTAYLNAGPSRLGIVEENAPATYEDVDVAQPVAGEDGGAWLVAHGLAVPTTSEHQAAALEFARFVANAENQLALSQQSSVFPSNGGALEDPFFSDPGEGVEERARAIAAESLRTGQAYDRPHEAVDTQYEEELWSQLQLAIMGDEDPAEALARAEAALTDILQARSQ